MSSPTVGMRRRLHADRWSDLGEDTGLRGLSSVLTPDELKQFEIFDGLPDDFLEELSPDISVAEWESDITLFEEGSYLDLAFYVVEGEVDVHLHRREEAAQPIFTARMVAPDLSPPTTGAPKPAAPTQAVPAPSSGDAEITYLSTMDFDLRPGGRKRLGEGEFFGEIGALNGWPQSVTARTASRCTLVQIRVPALRKLRRKSKTLKERLDDIYRDRTLRSHLASTPLLSVCDDRVVEELAEKVDLVSCQPGENLVQEGEAAEHLFLVRSGFLRLSQTVGEGEVVVSYLSKGSTLGEVELLIDGVEAWRVSASSVGHSELVRIRRQDFRAIVDGEPGLERLLWEVAVDRIRETGFTRKHLERSDLIEFGLAKGLVQGSSVLVIDLETCTRCDDCVRGCAETHGGIPRFVREGEKYQNFLVPRSCYHCEDPVCLIGCPTGAIRRAKVGDVVEIDPNICIGCSMCAQNCPYDAIVMHELGETWPEDAVPERLRGRPRRMASKCDLCHASEAGPACVASCPHGCAYRVTSLDEFDGLLAAAKEAEGAR